MTRKRIVIACGVIGVLIALALRFVFSPGFSPWLRAAFFLAAYQDRRTQVRLLCETNLPELLEACRQMMRDSELYEPGMKYLVRGATHVPRLPRPILNLEPSAVFTPNPIECIRLEMAGGTYHFGVIAYPENFQKPYSSFEYGDRELIPGLWYYDDGYRHNPDYGKKIEELLQKHR